MTFVFSLSKANCKQGWSTDYKSFCWAPEQQWSSFDRRMIHLWVLVKDNAEIQDLPIEKKTFQQLPLKDIVYLDEIFSDLRMKVFMLFPLFFYCKFSFFLAWRERELENERKGIKNWNLVHEWSREGKIHFPNFKPNWLHACCTFSKLTFRFLCIQKRHWLKASHVILYSKSSPLLFMSHVWFLEVNSTLVLLKIANKLCINSLETWRKNKLS